MALVSPGIQVTVTDQSNYVPSANGTVPYILLATAQDKAAPGGGVASGTLAENAGKLYAITSQRDLVNTFGSPIFQQTASANPINGSELNEYGLLAAYSALGVSNQIFVQRADVDLSELNGSTSRPVGNPPNGTYWLDSDSTAAGLFVWDATKKEFTAVNPLIDTSQTQTPDDGFGVIGDYLLRSAVIPLTVWYKRSSIDPAKNNTWVQVGSTEWQLSVPAIFGSSSFTANAGTIVINNITPPIDVAAGANATAICESINSHQITGISAKVVQGAVTIAISSDAKNGQGTAEISGTALSSLGIEAGTYNCAVTTHSTYFNAPKWTDTIVGDTPRPTGSIWIKTSHVGDGTNIAVNQYNSSTQQWSSVNVNNYYGNAEATYYADTINGGSNIPAGTVWAKYNSTGVSGLNEFASWELWYRKHLGSTTTIGLTIAAPNESLSSFVIQATQPGVNGYDSRFEFQKTFEIGTTAKQFASQISGLGIPGVQAEVNQDGKIVLTHKNGGEIRFSNVTGDILETMGLTYNKVGNEVISATNFYSETRDGEVAFISSNWAPLTELNYLVATSAPPVAPDTGTMWYWNNPTHVDVMINHNGEWKGYQNVTSDVRGYDLSSTDPAGVQVQTTPPTTQSTGVDLVPGDLWLDSSDLENFPRLYRYQLVNNIGQWVLIDNTDNVSQNGIIFADARWSTSVFEDPVFGAIPSQNALANSDHTDPDCPSPALYPRGILLFNTRASSYNVKKYVENYFTEAAYPDANLPPDAAPDTWVSVSGNQIGSTLPAFGRIAQRNVVVAAMKAAIDSSTAVREEQNMFNILACPGYPELIPNMIALNNDRNNTGFIIGDTPMRLAANGTDIIEWAQNTQTQSQTNEKGLTNHDPYLAVYYPSALTNDLSGNAVVVPPSHAMIRTMIRSDNASYPWFPAAGTRRGLLDNVNAVGYLDKNSGAFVSIGVTQGLRDTLYTNSINPLTYLQGAGLVCYGNKTTAGTPSALDRINVSRLINYIRLQLDRLARPYIFEPNDPITRNQIKIITEGLMNDIVSKRGITDYLVVCDTSNNTPDRIARNELYVDVAIQPTKDVEFIYIPIRLKNPGELESGNVSSSLTVGTGA